MRRITLRLSDQQYRRLKREARRQDITVQAFLIEQGEKALRTQEEKEETVRKLLRDPVWKERSDAWIADEAKVSWYTVRKVINRLRMRRDRVAKRGTNAQTYPASVPRAGEATARRKLVVGGANQNK